MLTINVCSNIWMQQSKIGSVTYVNFKLTNKQKHTRFLHKSKVRRNNVRTSLWRQLFSQRKYVVHMMTLCLCVHMYKCMHVWLLFLNFCVSVPFEVSSFISARSHSFYISFPHSFCSESYNRISEFLEFIYKLKVEC